MIACLMMMHRPISPYPMRAVVKRWEITIRSGGMIFRAEKTTEDRKQSLAQAGDLLFRQIVKNKSKLADRFKKRAPEIYAEPRQRSRITA